MQVLKHQTISFILTKEQIYNDSHKSQSNRYAHEALYHGSINQDWLNNLPLTIKTLLQKDLIHQTMRILSHHRYFQYCIRWFWWYSSMGKQAHFCKDHTWHITCYHLYSRSSNHPNKYTYMMFHQHIELESINELIKYWSASQNTQSESRYPQPRGSSYSQHP